MITIIRFVFAYWAWSLVVFHDLSQSFLELFDLMISWVRIDTINSSVSAFANRTLIFSTSTWEGNNFDFAFINGVYGHEGHLFHAWAIWKIKSSYTKWCGNESNQMAKDNLWKSKQLNRGPQEQCGWHLNECSSPSSHSSRRWCSTRFSVLRISCGT